jgi:hypothetical protein
MRLPLLSPKPEFRSSLGEEKPRRISGEKTKRYFFNKNNKIQFENQYHKIKMAYLL